MTRSQPPVLTGHDNGVISINIAEADDAERERRRASLHEPYRTLLGHIRHEIGHYYWDRLIAPSAYRAPDASAPLFGDEREDYAAALQRHYAEGAAGRLARPGSSRPTPARTRGRTGPRRGRTTCT